MSEQTNAQASNLFSATAKLHPGEVYVGPVIPASHVRAHVQVTSLLMATTSGDAC